jgi:phosphoserine phosphatase RsbU/P
LCLVCAVPVLKAQAAPKAAAASAAQPLDATNLREPVEIGTQGLVQAGDDPAYAQPEFDDSKWLPVNAKSRLSDYFPQNQPNIVWWRLHIRVSSGQTRLALQANWVSRAFEVYVNGQKLIESGRVEPYVPYSEFAPLIAVIPESQLRTGLLVIAIRVRAPRVTWGSPNSGFRAPMLTLGEEKFFESQSKLGVIGTDAASLFIAVLALGVALVALALFAAQRKQHEYLWVFMMGAVGAARAPLAIIEQIHNLPSDWWTSTNWLVFSASDIALLLLCQAFLRRRFSWQIWLGFIFACLTEDVAYVAYYHGGLTVAYLGIARIPHSVVFSLIVPWLFFRQLRRGNREAGILLVPLIFWSMWYYAFSLSALLVQIPMLRPAGHHMSGFIDTLHIGMFRIYPDDVGTFSFWLSLAIIMTLRSTRMSRQQTVLEGEMAAARQVQQIILPEQIEAVPGFTVESVYLPAQQVGGDFFQILPAESGGLLVVVGDVAGKGLPAAMLVSVLVGAVRGVAEYTKDPAELLANLNERLVGRGGFATALVVRIAADGQVTIANAGHLSPYLDGREVELPGAFPLGAISGATYDPIQFHLPHGSRLTFYSDGVVEAQNQQGELFGFDRARALSTEPAAAIVEAAKQFGQSDDITVVTIERQIEIASVA